MVFGFYFASSLVMTEPPRFPPPVDYRTSLVSMGLSFFLSSDYFDTAADLGGAAYFYDFFAG
jgi:hypothetical protein